MIIKSYEIEKKISNLIKLNLILLYGENNGLKKDEWKLNEDVNRSVYKVYILSNDKKRYSFIWQIEKVETEGELKNCWMTTSVSSAEFLGEVI